MICCWSPGWSLPSPPAPTTSKPPKATAPSAPTGSRFGFLRLNRGSSSASQHVQAHKQEKVWDASKLLLGQTCYLPAGEEKAAARGPGAALHRFCFTEDDR